MGTAGGGESDGAATVCSTTIAALGSVREGAEPVTSSTTGRAVETDGEVRDDGIGIACTTAISVVDINEDDTVAVRLFITSFDSNDGASNIFSRALPTLTTGDEGREGVACFPIVSVMDTGRNDAASTFCTAVTTVGFGGDSAAAACSSTSTSREADRDTGAGSRSSSRVGAAWGGTVIACMILRMFVSWLSRTVSSFSVVDCSELKLPLILNLPRSNDVVT